MVDLSGISIKGWHELNKPKDVYFLDRVRPKELKGQPVFLEKKYKGYEYTSIKMFILGYSIYLCVRWYYRGYINLWYRIDNYREHTPVELVNKIPEGNYTCFNDILLEGYSKLGLPLGYMV